MAAHDGGRPRQVLLYWYFRFSQFQFWGDVSASTRGDGVGYGWQENNMPTVRLVHAAEVDPGHDPVDTEVTVFLLLRGIIIGNNLVVVAKRFS